MTTIEKDALLDYARSLEGKSFKEHATGAVHPVLYAFEDGAQEGSPYIDLYSKGKREGWDPAHDLAWSTSVDPESPILPEEMCGLYGSDIWERLTPRERTRARHWNGAWTLGQFLHGERGALLATAQLVGCAPRTDQKLYAATQVQDEARHVEAYERYVREKMEKTFSPSPHLVALLDAILLDSRWDMKFLGMQILVEGLALAAFGWIRRFSQEPLIKEIITRIQRDEARHVAFGVAALSERYKDLSDSERRAETRCGRRWASPSRSAVRPCSPRSP
ncbi:ferritin-like domain-containing protein [bacterium]|nr:ferritin-like domain-containing protein [bacterium]